MTAELVRALLSTERSPEIPEASDLYGWWTTTDPQGAVSLLKQGGYVVVFRHGATDESQKDIYPFRFEDMKAQRQLNEKGRETARTIGVSLKELGILIGEVYTSRLNRAVETGKLIGAGDVVPKDELTDSSAGSASSMANPEGNNEKLGRSLRELGASKATATTNVLIVTHKTNVTDAFGKTYADIQEGEALIFRPTTLLWKQAWVLQSIGKRISSAKKRCSNRSTRA